MADENSKDLAYAYAYAELLEILSLTDTSLTNKIPKKLINLFQTNASTDYKNHLTVTKPLEEQNISKKTASLIALLSLNYWCETEDEKNEIKSILLENSKIKQKELREKYNPDNIFNNNKATDYIEEKSISSSTITDNKDIKNTNLPMDYSTLPWYKKVFFSFKNFLFKIFKKENNPT